jgi:hypothetical protein
MPVHFLRRYISEFVEAAKGHRAWLSEPSTAPVCAEVMVRHLYRDPTPFRRMRVATLSAPRAADDLPSPSLELRGYFIDAGLGALVVSAR